MNKTGLMILTVVILLVGLFFGGSYFYKAQQAEKIGFLAKENFSLFVRTNSPTYGDENAKVYLVEYLDPECETCRSFYPHIKKLLSKYKGKLKLVVRYAPFHANSEFAIRILEAARMQGKYWDTLALLFETQPQWGGHHNSRPELIWDFLPSLGLDIEKIRRDMTSSHIDEIIRQDIEDGETLGVRQTPGFFVNGKTMTTFGLVQLEELVRQEINAAYN